MVSVMDKNARCLRASSHPLSIIIYEIGGSIMLQNCGRNCAPMRNLTCPFNRFFYESAWR